MGRARDKSGQQKDRVIPGIILTGIGIIFLLANYGILPDIGDSWPLILIVVGVALLVSAQRGKKESQIPGAQGEEVHSPPLSKPPPS